ncbi:MAG: 3-isopropylmalate dehydrogenase [Deltaproteobacteria bacterium]|nr:3-isopropylmalate dehydrogenase [Deltaproteobacteria bacterium]
MSNVKKVAVLPGDGIGPEIIAEAIKVLGVVSKKKGVQFEFTEGLIGGAAIDATGGPFPDETKELVQSSDAVLLGAVGGPRWENLDYSIRPERALLGLRAILGAFANLRPAKIYDALADASTLKREVIEGIDIMVVRELTGGIYFGQPKGVETLPGGGKKGFNTLTYTTPEIERIARVAFEVAGKRGKKVCSVDKANVLECTELWREVVTNVHKDYSHIELSHMYVDNAAMQLIRYPAQFDVIVTTNMFGDILSDEASMLTGSIGMLPSASIGGEIGIFEPIHGSAPDIAGQGKANPIATIMSAAMMVKYAFGMDDVYDDIDSAIVRILDKGYRTPDIMQEGSKSAGCKEMGDLIVAELENS